MGLELHPPVGGEIVVAVHAALALEGVDVDDEPEAHRSAWRAAGLAEGVERAPSAAVWACYSALSPRSMRGATRA